MTQNGKAMKAAMDAAMKEAYIHSVTQEIVQLFHEGYSLSNKSFIHYIDEDEEVVYETPINNQFPIRLQDQQHLRNLLSMIYEKSGPLLAEPGGCDLIGNVWIKMRCRVPAGVPGQYVLLTEAVLWIFRPDLKPQHNPIDYIKQKREMAGITLYYPKRWAELHYAAVQMQMCQMQIHEKAQQQTNQIHRFEEAHLDVSKRQVHEEAQQQITQIVKSEETHQETRQSYVYKATKQHLGQGRLELRMTHCFQSETN